MIIGFIIWSSCALLIIKIGILTWNSKKPDACPERRMEHPRKLIIFEPERLIAY